MRIAVPGVSLDGAGGPGGTVVVDDRGVTGLLGLKGLLPSLGMTVGITDGFSTFADVADFGVDVLGRVL